MRRTRKTGWFVTVVLATACGDDDGAITPGSTEDSGSADTLPITDDAGSSSADTSSSGGSSSDGGSSTDVDTSSGAAETSTDPSSSEGGSSDGSSSSSGDDASSSGSTEGPGPTCGDGTVDDGEDCDGDVGTATCVDLGHSGGALACSASCSFDTSACTDFVAPALGDLVITEIMKNPTALGDDEGEWFEIHNPNLVEAFQLGGCTVEGAGEGEGFAIDGDLVITADEYVTFATSAAPGFEPDYVWSGAFALTNAGDTIRLVCSGGPVDEVGYDGGTSFPDTAGASMQLDPLAFDVVSNDSGSNWCDGLLDYNLGDHGSPGAANISCASVDYTIDFCRLQFPTALELVEGDDVDAFGRLFVAGLTDLSGANDPAQQVIGEVGYGPDGSDPAVDAGWVWSPGAPNAGYGPGSPSYEPNNDEYQASFVVPVAGDYDFAFRFTGDGGASYTYCDGQDAGSSNGYAPADAGQLVANLPPPPANLYFSEYVEGSANNKALEIFNASGGAAELEGCELRFYFNGSMAAGATVTLAGTIAQDGVQVVCDDDIADGSACDVLAGGSFFSGDDAVELRCDDVVLDVIGQIGVDPGAEWLVGGVGTANETLRRSCDVTSGDTNGGDVFDPSAQWSTAGQDDLTDLGQYACPE